VYQLQKHALDEVCLSPVQQGLDELVTSGSVLMQEIIPFRRPFFFLIQLVVVLI
jgi:hypothetical protein